MNLIGYSWEDGAADSQSSRPTKYVALTDPLYDYIARQRSRVVDPSSMRSAPNRVVRRGRPYAHQPEQGDFLTLLTQLLNVRTAVEVGTFTGDSSICLARGLADGGRLHCFDVNAEWALIARRYWKKDGLASRIELQLGDAKKVLLDWEPPVPLDLVFIDADKPGYDTYFEILLPKMKPNGLFIFDNMVWSGRVIEQPFTDPDGLCD